MKKMNMRKKIVAALIAANGISAISGGNLSAMETLITMKQLHMLEKNKDKDLTHCIEEVKEVDWNKIPLSKIMTRKQMKNLLNKNKPDIFYAIELGEPKRQKAITSGSKGSWSDVGRGELHKKQTKDNYKGITKQIDWSLNGSINCTQWAHLIHWFLNKNGIPAKLITEPGYHRLVMVPIKTKNEELRLYTIEVDEHVDSLSDVEFIIEPLFDTNDLTDEEYKKNTQDLLETPWDGFVDFSKSGSYRTDKDRKKITINPPMQLLQIINNGCASRLYPHSMPLDHLAAWVKEYQTQLKKCSAEAPKLIITNYENGYRDYNVRLLPHDDGEHRVYIPLNIEYLGAPVEKNYIDNYGRTKYNREFEVLGHSETTTPLLLGEIRYTKEDAHADRNKTIRISKSKNGELEAHLYGVDGKEERNLYMIIKDDIPENSVGFWNYDKYGKNL